MNYNLQRNESEQQEGMAVASSVVGDDSTNPTASPSTNPDDNEGHKEASGKKKKNRCLSCKKKVGLTGKYFSAILRNFKVQKRKFEPKIGS